MIDQTTFARIPTYADKAGASADLAIVDAANEWMDDTGRERSRPLCHVAQTIRVHKARLNVVLHDQFPEQDAEKTSIFQGPIEPGERRGRLIVSKIAQKWDFEQWNTFTDVPT